MEGKGNKPKVLSCMIKGPGPVYKLPTLVGHTGHDPSRRRSPAYSMRIRPELKIGTIGPGPRYNIEKLTKSGPDNPPAYTIRSREKWRLRDLGPGPGAHSPELCPPMNHNRRPPAYSIRPRDDTKYLDKGPGPSAYLLPTCIGPKIPDKPAQGAFSIVGFREIRGELLGPGPAAYAGMDYNVVKRRNPVFSMKGRNFFTYKHYGPAPTFYPLYDTRKRSPMYSFGVRHSECAGTPITQLDEN